MAANISFKNGKAEAFTGLTPAWWDGKGEYVLDHYPTSDEIFGERGLLNWHVGKHRIADADRGNAPIPGYVATVREDTGATLGIVSKDYTVVQNKEAFAFLDSLLQDGVIRYESAGAIKGGRMVWLLARLPSIDTIAAGDEQARYVTFINSHDGTSAINIFPTAVRVVCQNTMRAALSARNKAKYKSIRHEGDVAQKLEDAKIVLSEVDVQFTKYAEAARKLTNTHYTEDSAKKFIETLFPIEKDVTQRALTSRNRKVDAVRAALLHPTNNLPSMRGTYWRLVNAVSFAVDHGSLLNFRGSNKADNRMVSLMLGGNGDDLKTKAIETALALAS